MNQTGPYQKVEIIETPWPAKHRVTNKRASATSLHHLRRGAIKALWQQDSFTVESGAFLWIPSGQPFTWRCPHGEVRRTSMHLRADAWSPANQADAEATQIISTINQRIIANGPLVQCTEATERAIKKLLTIMREIYVRPELPNHCTGLKAGAMEIIGLLINDELFSQLPLVTENNANERALLRVEPVLHHLDRKEFIAQENLSVADLARLCGYQVSRFHSLFVQATGLTPQRYLTQKRITRACYLLQHTDDRIVDIGFACGFNSQSRFYHAFTTIIGTSPARWRRKVMSEGKQETQ